MNPFTVANLPYRFPGDNSYLGLVVSMKDNDEKVYSRCRLLS